MITESDPASFAELLKGFRTRRHFTQHQLAAAIGVHRNAIGRWERGDVLPAQKGMVLELAKHLRLDDQEARHLLEASLTPLAPHWLIPLPRNLFFTGRAEILEALHTHLSTDWEAEFMQPYALYGLGGIGKTQIALEYAYRYALEYRAVFWIGAETTEEVLSSLLHIAEILQLPERQEKDQQRIATAVQHWLSTHSQWLLIWDNLEDLELLRFLPQTLRGATLITMRDPASGTIAQGMELASMGREESVLFLLRRAKALHPEATSEQMRQRAERMPGEYAAVEELVTSMGGLPLALDQAGAYIEETGCSFTDYLQRYTQLSNA
jgi:transcriptional regulator with XRE-family HTH domain